MRSWRRCLSLVPVVLAAVFAAPAALALPVAGASPAGQPVPVAEAAQRGFLVISSGELGRPDASVVLLDLASVVHSGDQISATVAMVVVQPEISRVPGMSYMIGHERLSCRDRTSRTTRVEVYDDSGAKLTEFEGSVEPEVIQPQSAVHQKMSSSR